MVQIVAGVEKLEEFRISEITHSLHAGAFHLDAYSALSFSSGNFFPCLPVTGVRSPGNAFHERITAFFQDIFEFLPVLFVYGNGVTAFDVVITRSLVANRASGYDDAAVFDGFIQHTAIAKQYQAFASHGHQVFVLGDAEGFSYIRLEKGIADAFVFHLINGITGYRRSYLGQLFGIE